MQMGLPTVTLLGEEMTGVPLMALPRSVEHLLESRPRTRVGIPLTLTRATELWLFHTGISAHSVLWGCLTLAVVCEKRTKVAERAACCPAFLRLPSYPGIAVPMLDAMAIFPLQAEEHS